MSIIELINEKGLRVVVMSRGAILQSVHFPDRDGHVRDLTLGFDNLEGYLADRFFMGQTVGRVCNRIRNGRFELNGRFYQLDINREPNHLHGGGKGCGLRDWEVARRSDTSVTFRVIMKNDEDGYPGDAKIDCTYTLNDMNQLIIEYTGICTEDSVLNLTNHTYWNLDGDETINEHLLEIRAHSYLPTDATKVPTGEILSVEGTKFDFRSAKKLGTLLESDGIGRVDNDYILSDVKHQRSVNILLASEKSGIMMEMLTNYPIAHVYAGEYVTNTMGKGGKIYKPNSGIAIECQGYTNAVNEPKFPSIRVEKGEVFSREIVYGFGHLNTSEISGFTQKLK
ncbi:unnamed protein product, partial [Mesorhabditis belari]|uniref:Aldose 1-epimerase n=1 Tax=Mesorhabditis belari TaxID=2138241 RepID=A0AAF3FR62_9BILA